MTVKALVLGLLFTMLSACDQDNHTAQKSQSNSINKILPLGASRVEGARPEFESYRYELWKDLKENNWKFDFIGTQSDNAYYPPFIDMEFDANHEGRGGWTSGQLLEGLIGWLDQTGSPDVVLFSSPVGNDILNGQDYNQTISNINTIIDVLQSDNPNVTIIIEQPAPGHSEFMTPEYTDAFSDLREDVLTISNRKSTASSQVIPVDMFTGFNDSHLADGVHYNEAGAAFIAERYYEVLETVLE